MERDWGELNGGYGVPYDPRPAIAKLHAEPLASGARELGALLARAESSEIKAFLEPAAPACGLTAC